MLGGGGYVWIFSHSKEESSSSYSRVQAHLCFIPQQGIKFCTGKPRFNGVLPKTLLPNYIVNKHIQEQKQVDEAAGRASSHPFQNARKKTKTSSMSSTSTSNEPPVEGHPFLRAPQEPIAKKRAMGTLETSFQNETRDIVEEAIVRCVYACELAFNVVHSPYWQKMVRSINEAPKGFKGPGYEKVHTTLLDREVAETHFVSNTIVLRCLVKIKEALSRMVISTNWSIWRQSNSAKAAAIKTLLLDDSWWVCAKYLLKFTEPILSMIRYTDMDRPFLGEVYDGIDSMIDDIRNIINAREEDPDEKFFKEL